ncbi:glycosyltransferase family 4 protein [Ruegeria sp. SCP11]|uniref:glycosyltransferase family 4 protein n=1 Tax=Ruegeria sp. SCP11 TaxID=3141378 RepID=UPI00333566B2
MNDHQSKCAPTLFVTRKWLPAIGGMETYSVKLSAALARYAPVEIVALPGRDNGDPPTATALLKFGILTFLRILFTRKPTGVVHVADIASWPLAFAARIRSRRWRIVLSAHGTDVSYSLRGGVQGRLYGAYLWLGARCLKSARVISNSVATSKCASGHGFKDLVVVPLATDSRPVHSVRKPENFILFAGRLVERKGCSWFILNVLPLLPEDITLKVAGTIWSESEADALNLPRVDYLGPQDPGDMADLYARALCVVTPNIVLANGEFEGFGLVATEAAASGGVSLAAKCQGLHEAIVDGVTGFHLPPGEPGPWAQKISEISGWQPNRRAAFIERSIAECRTKYSWSRVAEETFAAYGDAPRSKAS